MPDTMTDLQFPDTFTLAVEVTAEDIANATPGSAVDCPGARAATRALRAMFPAMPHCSVRVFYGVCEAMPESALTWERIRASKYAQNPPALVELIRRADGAEGAAAPELVSFELTFR